MEKLLEKASTLRKLLIERKEKDLPCGDLLNNNEGKLAYIANPFRNGNTCILGVVLEFQTNTFMSLTIQWWYEDNEIIHEFGYDYCGNLKEAKCIMSNSLLDGLINCSYHDILRCLKHHNDHWIIQKIDDNDKVLKQHNGRIHTTKKRDDKLKGLPSSMDCISFIMVNDKHKLHMFVDNFFFEKKTGKFLKLITTELNNGQEIKDFIKAHDRGHLLL